METTPAAPHAVLLTTLALRLRTLVLFRGVFAGEGGRHFRRLVDLLASPDAGSQAEALECFAALQAILLTWPPRPEQLDSQRERAVERPERVRPVARAAAPQSGSNGAQPGPAPDLWQAHLLDRVLTDENAFSLAAEMTPADELPAALVAQAAAELRTLQQAYALSLERMVDALAARSAGEGPALRDLWTFAATGAPGREGGEHRTGIAARLAGASDYWGALAPSIADHFFAHGCGDFGRYAAFRWVGGPDRRALEPVPAPDAVRLNHLVAYDLERELVLSNTLRFVLGAPGNNVLLYGDAGTGKSSLVKALLNQYADQGLRLIEVTKERLGDFPYIAEVVRGRRQRFILFVDDLSFEEDETEYKALKALLEGGVQARPENLLIYATSNRRHLVREQFADRSRPADDDVHPHETAQEKVSLSERFGIRVAFLTPEQPRYLAIVDAIARQEGIEFPADELHRRALVWAQWQNGFSGRTARQFVNDLLGELRERAAG